MVLDRAALRAVRSNADWTNGTTLPDQVYPSKEPPFFGDLPAAHEIQNDHGCHGTFAN